MDGPRETDGRVFQYIFFGKTSLLMMTGRIPEESSPRDVLSLNGSHRHTGLRRRRSDKDPHTKRPCSSRIREPPSWERRWNRKPPTREDLSSRSRRLPACPATPEADMTIRRGVDMTPMPEYLSRAFANSSAATEASSVIMSGRKRDGISSVRFRAEYFLKVMISPRPFSERICSQKDAPFRPAAGHTPPHTRSPGADPADVSGPVRDTDRVSRVEQG